MRVLNNGSVCTWILLHVTTHTAHLVKNCLHVMLAQVKIEGLKLEMMIVLKVFYSVAVHIKKDILPGHGSCQLFEIFNIGFSTKALANG